MKNFNCCSYCLRAYSRFDYLVNQCSIGPRHNPGEPTYAFFCQTLAQAKIGVELLKASKFPDLMFVGSEGWSVPKAARECIKGEVERARGIAARYHEPGSKFSQDDQYRKFANFDMVPATSDLDQFGLIGRMLSCGNMEGTCAVFDMWSLPEFPRDLADTFSDPNNVVCQWGPDRVQRMIHNATAMFSEGFDMTNVFDLQAAAGQLVFEANKAALQQPRFVTNLAECLGDKYLPQWKTLSNDDTVRAYQSEFHTLPGIATTWYSMFDLDVVLEYDRVRSPGFTLAKPLGQIGGIMNVPILDCAVRDPMRCRDMLVAMLIRHNKSLMEGDHIEPIQFVTRLRDMLQDERAPIMDQNRWLGNFRCDAAAIRKTISDLRDQFYHVSLKDVRECGPGKPERQPFWYDYRMDSQTEFDGRGRVKKAHRPVAFPTEPEWRSLIGATTPKFRRVVGPLILGTDQLPEWPGPAPFKPTDAEMKLLTTKRPLTLTEDERNLVNGRIRDTNDLAANNGFYVHDGVSDAEDYEVDPIDYVDRKFTRAKNYLQNCKDNWAIEHRNCTKRQLVENRKQRRPDPYEKEYPLVWPPMPSAALRSAHRRCTRAETIGFEEPVEAVQQLGRRRVILVEDDPVLAAQAAVPQQDVQPMVQPGDVGPTAMGGTPAGQKLPKPGSNGGSGQLKRPKAGRGRGRGKPMDPGDDKGPGSGGVATEPRIKTMAERKYISPTGLIPTGEATALPLAPGDVVISSTGTEVAMVPADAQTIHGAGPVDQPLASPAAVSSTGRSDGSEADIWGAMEGLPSSESADMPTMVSSQPPIDTQGPVGPTGLLLPGQLPLHIPPMDVEPAATPDPPFKVTDLQAALAQTTEGTLATLAPSMQPIIPLDTTSQELFTFPTQEELLRIAQDADSETLTIEPQELFIGPGPHVDLELAKRIRAKKFPTKEEIGKWSPRTVIETAKYATHLDDAEEAIQEHKAKTLQPPGGSLVQSAPVSVGDQYKGQAIKLSLVSTKQSPVESEKPSPSVVVILHDPNLQSAEPVGLMDDLLANQPIVPTAEQRERALWPQQDEAAKDTRARHEELYRTMLTLAQSQITALAPAMVEGVARHGDDVDISRYQRFGAEWDYQIQEPPATDRSWGLDNVPLRPDELTLFSPETFVPRDMIMDADDYVNKRVRDMLEQLGPSLYPILSEVQEPRPIYSLHDQFSLDQVSYRQKNVMLSSEFRTITYHVPSAWYDQHMSGCEVEQLKERLGRELMWRQNRLARDVYIQQLMAPPEDMIKDMRESVADEEIPMVSEGNRLRVTPEQQVLLGHTGNLQDPFLHLAFLGVKTLERMEQASKDELERYVQERQPRTPQASLPVYLQDPPSPTNGPDPAYGVPEPERLILQTAVETCNLVYHGENQQRLVEMLAGRVWTQLVSGTDVPNRTTRLGAVTVERLRGVLLVAFLCFRHVCQIYRWSYEELFHMCQQACIFIHQRLASAMGWPRTRTEGFTQDLGVIMAFDTLMGSHMRPILLPMRPLTRQRIRIELAYRRAGTLRRDLKQFRAMSRLACTWGGITESAADREFIDRDRALMNIQKSRSQTRTPLIISRDGGSPVRTTAVSSPGHIGASSPLVRPTTTGANLVGQSPPKYLGEFTKKKQRTHKRLKQRKRRVSKLKDASTEYQRQLRELREQMEENLEASGESRKKKICKEAETIAALDEEWDEGRGVFYGDDDEPGDEESAGETTLVIDEPPRQTGTTPSWSSHYEPHVSVGSIWSDEDEPTGAQGGGEHVSRDRQPARSASAAGSRGSRDSSAGAAQDQRIVRPRSTSSAEGSRSRSHPRAIQYTVMRNGRWVQYRDLSSQPKVGAPPASTDEPLIRYQTSGWPTFTRDPWVASDVISPPPGQMPVGLLAMRGGYHRAGSPGPLSMGSTSMRDRSPRAASVGVPTQQGQGWPAPQIQPGGMARHGMGRGDFSSNTDYRGQIATRRMEMVRSRYRGTAPVGHPTAFSGPIVCTTPHRLAPVRQPGRGRATGRLPLIASAPTATDESRDPRLASVNYQAARARKLSMSTSAESTASSSASATAVTLAPVSSASAAPDASASTVSESSTATGQLPPAFDVVLEEEATEDESTPPNGRQPPSSDGSAEI